MTARALFLVSTLLVAACGGATAPPPGAPSPAPVKDEPSPEPQTIEDAEREISRARAELEPRELRLEAPQATEDRGSASRKSDRAENACANPCRALASMQRAVEALCRMTGEGDARCVDAHKTLRESTARVTHCHC